jgi:hypothetical protein
VVAVFAAAVLLQVVAAQGARQDAQLAVPQAWEPEQDVPQAAQPVAQAARLAPDALPGDPQVAPPVPAALLALRSVAWRVDLLADSVAARLAALLADPRVARPVPDALPAVHSDAWLADPQVDLQVLDALLALRSDVWLADLLDGRPDDYLAARLADDHSWPAAVSQAVWR